MLLLSGFVVLLLAPAFLALRDGAPPDICDMEKVEPQHQGVKKHNGNGFYTLTTSPTTIKAGKPITVTLSGSPAFKGFVIWAEYSDGTRIKGGQWTETKDAKAVPCDEMRAITHRNPTLKDKVTAVFDPPEGEDDVVFKATVVVNYGNFYSDIKSKTSSRSSSSSSLLHPSDDRVGQQPIYETYSPNYPIYGSQAQAQAQTNYEPEYSPQYDPQSFGNYRQPSYQPQYAPNRGDYAPAPYNQYEAQASAYGPAQYEDPRNSYPAGFAAFIAQAKQQQSYPYPSNPQQRYSPYQSQQRHDAQGYQQQYGPQQYPRYQQPVQPNYNYGQRRYSS